MYPCLDAAFVTSQLNRKCDWIVPLGVTGRSPSFLRSSVKPPAFAIAIPARNEAERIVPCLDACHAAIVAAGDPGRTLLLVNNSTDATATLAADWAERSGAALDIVEVVLPPAHAHAGTARALALDLARHLVGPSGALMTTDADSRPARDWAVGNLRALERGAALVCGRIELDAVEHARLPAALTAKGTLDETYFRAALELGSLIDPDPFNPWPHHGQTSGASLAISARAYDRIGGMPATPCGEDRALVRRVIEHDLPVVHSDVPCVATSCRLDGRARGGMADTISDRLLLDDYPCDEGLETPELVVLRADFRARARRLWSSGTLPDRLFGRLGLSAAQRRRAASQSGFGALWAFVEERSPRLARRTLLHSEVAALLPHLLKRLEAARRTRLPAFGTHAVTTHAGQRLEGALA